MKDNVKKRNGVSIIAVFCVAVMMIVLQSTALVATADSVEWTTKYNGYCGKTSRTDVSWKYSTHTSQVESAYYNNKLSFSTIGGANAGVMANYTWRSGTCREDGKVNGDERPWEGLIAGYENLYMLDFEEGVKSIGNFAFDYVIRSNYLSSSQIPEASVSGSKIRYLFLPDTLESIGLCAFSGALKYVDSITIPANVSNLDWGSFCSNGFNEIIIEEGNLTSIPDYSFANCTALEEIYIPRTVTNISSGAFSGCTSLKKIYYGGTKEDWQNMTIASEEVLYAEVSFPIQVHVSSVSLNTTSRTMFVGDTYELIATVSPDNADITDVEWSSSKPSVATVNNGVVTALSPGTTTITVKSVEGGKTDTCVIAVQSSKVNVKSVSLNKTSVALNVGETELLSATVYPANATNKTISWKSSDTNVATVLNGIVVAKAAGTTIITVTTADGSKIATCVVSVAGKTKISAFKFRIIESYVIIDIAVENMTTSGTLYFVAYDSKEKMVEFQSPTLLEDSAQIILPIGELHRIKAFIWHGSLQPITSYVERTIG